MGSKPSNHMRTCSCAVCVKMRAPKSTKVLLTITLEQKDYFQECGLKMGIPTSEAFRKALDFFREAHPVETLSPVKANRTLLEILTEDYAGEG